MATPNASALLQPSRRPLLRQLSEESTGLTGEREFLYLTLRQTVESADYLADHAGTAHTSGHYPDHEFGRHLRQAAGLIGAGAGTRFYYISLPGFDTHALQKNIQSRLLRIFDQGLSALIHDLKQLGVYEDTRIFVFSEFGRRVAQNGSNGTDHGAANIVFLAGGGLKQKGLINGPPDLNDLEDGDLRFRTDFRQVYASLLEEWMGEDAERILGKPFRPLGIL